MGFLLRVLVPQLLPKLTGLLDQFVLLATPVNSYRSLNEGLFLLVNGMNPYTSNGQILHHPPLVLALFNLIKDSPVEDNLSVNVFYALVDALICVQLIKLNRKFKTDFKSYQIALFYMFNPMSMVATLAKSTYLLNNLMVVSFLGLIMEQNWNLVMVLLAVSSYLSYYPWYLTFPVCYYALLESKGIFKPLKLAFIFAVTLGTLFVISFKITGDSWNFLNLCYGSIIKFEKITPNIGLWWYFFTEIFEFFSSFYIGLFNIYTFIFTIPLSIRFIEKSDVKSLVFTIWCIIAFFTFGKGYPCLADYSLVYSLTIVFQALFSQLKFSLLVINIALMVVMGLSPLFYFVWMAFNSGNANFFYAIGLSLNVLQMLILSDFIWAKIKIEYLDNLKLKNGVTDDGKTKLTQI